MAVLMIAIIFDLCKYTVYNKHIATLHLTEIKMKLNWQLFENFKQAASQCGLEVKPGKSYYSITLPNGRYIWCWTPLNKMWSLAKYYDREQWDMALNHLKDNFSDFHLEIDSRGHQDGVAECFYKECWNPDLSIQDIVKILEILQDDDRLERRRLMSAIEYE